tara:strand:- start:49 stop:822 length:774 start_codon:yes stop_codon:yes gene_type:complete
MELTNKNAPAIYKGSYLSSTQAQDLDQALFETWELAQLMELAGLAVACAVQDAFPSTTSSTPTKVLIFAGPGNNGGDGLVAARHLYHFGFQPTIIYPKLGKNKQLFSQLLQQCEDLDIPVVTQFKEEDTEGQVIVLDSIFGFSFKGDRGVRAPYDSILCYMRATPLPVVSIDVPSGWDVEKGDIYNLGVQQPSMLVSLTAPKLFVTTLRQGTRHYLGGRFLPPRLAAQYGLESAMSLYSGNNQIVELALEEPCETKE